MDVLCLQGLIDISVGVLMGSKTCRVGALENLRCVYCDLDTVQKRGRNEMLRVRRRGKMKCYGTQVTA